MLKILHALVICGLMGYSLTSAADTLIVEYPDDITLTVKTENFDKKSHKIKNCGDYVCLIDGKPFYGSDGNIPKDYLSALIFKHKNKSVELDVSSMYEPGITKENSKQYLSVEHYWGDFYKVTGHFSGGAAAYIAQWLINTDGAIRIHLSNFEELLDLSSKIKR